MKEKRARSLQWVLVRRLILLQAATLLVFILLFAAALWIANPRLLVCNEASVAVLKGAIDRDRSGRLIVNETSELLAFREEFPNVWYILRDPSGQSLQAGKVPDVYTKRAGELLNAVSNATLGFDENDMTPEAYVERVDTRAGPVQIITATRASRNETQGLEINISATVDVARNPDGTTNWLRVLPILAASARHPCDGGHNACDNTCSRSPVPCWPHRYRPPGSAH